MKNLKEKAAKAAIERSRPEAAYRSKSKQKLLRKKLHRQHIKGQTTQHMAAKL